MGPIENGKNVKELTAKQEGEQDEVLRFLGIGIDTSAKSIWYGSENSELFELRLSDENPEILHDRIRMGFLMKKNRGSPTSLFANQQRLPGGPENTQNG